MAKKGLGSGLDALFADSMPAGGDESLLTLPISKVEPAQNQPREIFDPEALDALADSIAQHGVLQPITVRRLQGDYYQIIAGERRWRAARQAGLSSIPARVVEADDREAMVFALVENLQREDLNPVEEARGIRSLLDEYGFTQEAAAKQLGRSRSALTNSLRLLNLPADVLAMLEDGRLTAGHARSLLPLEEEDALRSAAETVLRLNLSVRQTEQLVRSLLAGEKPKKEKEGPSIYVRALEERLTTRLGRKVRLVSGAKKGKLEIEYYGNEDLDRLLAALGVPNEE